MKIAQRIDRLHNMWKEFKRLNGLTFTIEGIKSDWRFASYKESDFGRPFKYVFDVNDRFVVGPDGEHLKMKRDLYDQVLDYFSGIAELYWKGIFVEERCSHPHGKVVVEWEGDSEPGYYQQHYCTKCKGYLYGDSDVDRYLPVSDRHPELIEQSPKPIDWDDDYTDRDYDYDRYDATDSGYYA